MKHTDAVMQEVWQAKEINVKRYQSLAAYLAYLRKQAKLKHAGGRVACVPVDVNNLAV
jgi:hypothetical protein